MIFLQKSYSEYIKVDKPVVFPTSYKVLGKKEELETVPVVINNSDKNVVHDSNTDSSEEDFKNNDKNFFDEDINNQVKCNF